MKDCSQPDRALADGVRMSEPTPETGPLESVHALGWLNAGFSPAFALKRLGVVLLLAYVPLAILIALDHPLLGALAMLPGIWPYRFAFVTEAGGLRIDWLMLRAAIPWQDLTGAEVLLDPRPFVIGRRGYFLRVTRRDRSALVIDAPLQELERLCRAIAAGRSRSLATAPAMEALGAEESAPPSLAAVHLDASASDAPETARASGG